MALKRGVLIIAIISLLGLIWVFWPGSSRAWTVVDVKEGSSAHSVAQMLRTEYWRAVLYPVGPSHDMVVTGKSRTQQNLLGDGCYFKGRAAQSRNFGKVLGCIICQFLTGLPTKEFDR